MKNKMLSQSVADSILSMITIEKRFSVGDKLPNEIELSEELNVSRTTLREAIRILVAYNILEIRRGKGTYVTEKVLEQPQDLERLSTVKVNAKDLYEMRLIFEPEAAYLAAVRGTDALFKVVNVPMQETIDDYVALAKKTEENQTDYFASPMANDIYQFSAFPWVAYTHISHTESGKKDHATPLFDWGKFYEQDGKIYLPFSVQVHHSFVDGVHIGKLAEKLQCYLDSFA